MKKFELKPHAHKSYASTYKYEVFNSFNLELQLKNTESPIRDKLINLLSKLRGFKFVTTLVLEFEKIKSDDETKCTLFHKQHFHKQRQAESGKKSSKG